jgi:NitT/TauT family transport system substrate-binding protein
MKIYLSLVCFFVLSLFNGIAQQITFSPQWTPQSQFAGYYAALENGYYADAGLDVSIVHPTATYSSMNMLQDGTSDVITCELIQAMMTADDNVKYVNLLQTTQHSTLVLIARSGDVEKLADLAGCRIGTWKVGFSEIPHMIDEEQHLDIEWIKLISPLNLYIAGAIDATLAKSYNELILFSMAGVTPGSVLYFSEHGYDFPEDGLYVSEEFYKKNPQQCRLFADASRKGWDWVRNNREEALDIVMEYVKKENVPTNRYNQKWMLDAILDAQEDVKGEMPSYTLHKEAFNQLNETLMKYGYISRPIVYERFVGGTL